MTQAGSDAVCIVIARPALAAVAIRLDCFAVPASGTTRNDKLYH